MRADVTATDPDLVAYVRHARQVRARFANRPAERARKLQQLAAERDHRLQRRDTAPGRVGPLPPGDTVSPKDGRGGVASPSCGRVTPAAVVPATPLLRIAPATAAAFADAVETALAEGDGVLRYSRRRRLLAYAATLRIPPFEANLLIASVLHHHRPTAGTAKVQDGPGTSVLAGLLTLAGAALLLAWWAS
ncbi:MAG: hypothetical protein ACK4PI_02135 [Tepidisphaerales bacterium]